MFLDYDGVVNTPMWNEKGTRCTYNFPHHGKVNNFQAVQWVSEFCQQYKYDIVVTSTWRMDSNYKDCLVNGGLRDTIRILGKTPILPGECRGQEVRNYLDKHPEIKYYIIIDDEDDMLNEQLSHFVQTNPNFGFGLSDFEKCGEIFMRDKGKGGSLA